MKKFKKTKVVALAALAAVAALTPCLTACGGGDNGPVDPCKYKGVTSDTIYVGNTAGTTGALAEIGIPFNYGIEAAFHKYNQGGGFSGTYDGNEVSGLKVALKHYDDGGDAVNAVTYMQRLIEEDEVFAIVGNYGSYAVNANLDIIKDAGVPMVYAAAGNESMAKVKATGTDRFIFPVQPIGSVDGSALIKRTFATAEDGGLAATKVGVISNNEDASLGILKGVQKGANSLTAAQKGNIVYQKVSDTNTGYGTAATALKNANCDVIIVAVVSDFVKTVSALMDAGFTSENVKIVTTYNNAATKNFDKTDGTGDTAFTHFDGQYADIIEGVYASAWIDITDDAFTGYFYKKDTSLLYASYVALAQGLVEQYPDNATYQGMLVAYQNYGVSGFNEEYWGVAEDLFNYGVAVPDALPDASLGFNAFTLSYNAYALAGYIAGDLFCKGLGKLGDKALTRTNYVDAMESGEIDLALADKISYKDGQRLGVQQFALNQFYAPYGVYSTTSSKVVYKLETFDYNA